MNKTLNIPVYQDPSTHIEKFLNQWLKFGEYHQNDDFSYRLIGKDNKTSILTLHHDQLTLSGHIPSETFMIIDELAKACESDKIIEGEVINKNDPNQSTSGFNGTFNQNFNNATFQSPFSFAGISKLTGLSKTKMILLMIISIPLLIITIPIIIVISIVKIIMFKLKYK